MKIKTIAIDRSFDVIFIRFDQSDIWPASSKTIKDQIKNANVFTRNNFFQFIFSIVCYNKHILHPFSIYYFTIITKISYSGFIQVKQKF